MRPDQNKSTESYKNTRSVILTKCHINHYTDTFCESFIVRVRAYQPKFMLLRIKSTHLSQLNKNEPT